jgi:photosystem II stability/assembly factor-like uncharacterized protein
MQNIILSIGMFLLLLQNHLFAQIPYTSGTERMTNEVYKNNLKQQSLLKNISFKNVGPTIMSGRVVDIAINPQDPTHFYVAYASGGLWETKNNGTTFYPLFDNQIVMSIGDISVDWKTQTIYIGTGENNSSRSSYSGLGVYKSTNNGKTWEYLGLPESHHIGRIVVSPVDTSTILVAALGHLYSENKERGIYKTTDGGKTWKQTLFVNENAGGIDLLYNPNKPNEWYAAIWERTRRAWDFTESGKGSGIYKSVDNGTTWTLISTTTSGFPTGEGVGRIGLDMYSNGDKTVIYAVLDNQFKRKATDKKTAKSTLTMEQVEKMTTDEFLKLDKTVIKTFLEENDFPKKYTVDKVKSMLKSGTITPVAFSEYVGNANKALFDTPVIGAEVYCSFDEGKTWQKTHTNYLDDLYYSYGYYFGQIRVAPQDFNTVYILGVPILRSIDGGKTFQSISDDNVHADHHALWCNSQKYGHIINGNDGGINISYDNGENWIKCNTPPVGQFYAVNVDMQKPYNIYGGLQDNGVWFGSSNYKQSVAWHQEGVYPYKELLGGDGMQIEIDLRDNNILYTGYQFGNYYRINRATNELKYIQPKHELGEKPFRFNWQTPIHLSTHNQDILYLGSNKLHRSFNQGTDFKVISDDLTKGGQKGDVAFGTLTTISESIFQFGLIYTGSDDGLVHCTKDGGVSWQLISKNLPQDLWVSRVVASRHNLSDVYVALNGYRWDDFTPYLYHSTDYGNTWRKINLGLPFEPINVVKEDPHNPNILYVGTDNGLYISLDKGNKFMALGNLPNVSVHDLVIHPRDKDIIVGTHGRSIYVANTKYIEQLDSALMAQSLHLFKLNNIVYNDRWGSSWSAWGKTYEYNMEIPFYTQKEGAVTITVATKDGVLLKTITTDASAGLNFVNYNLTVDKTKHNDFKKIMEKTFSEIKKEDLVFTKENGESYLIVGEYVVTLISGKESVKTTFEVTAKKKSADEE